MLSKVNCEHIENYANKMLSGLNRERIESDSSCDATLRVDGKDFRVHKLIVGKASPFFRKLFEVQMKEKHNSFADMKSMTVNIMESVLTYIYTGKIEAKNEDLEDLYSASNFLQMDELKCRCGASLSNTLSVANCLSLNDIGKRLSCDLICNKAEEMMQDEIAEIIKNEEFESLSFADVTTFLQSIDQISSVYKVKAVYEGVMAWVKHDLPAREKYLSDLLEIVKFRRLPSFYLNLIKKEEVLQDLSMYQSRLSDQIFWKRASIEHNSTTLSRKQFVVISEQEIRLFDVLSLTWRKLPDLPGDVSSACVVTYKEHLYVIGGTADPTLIQRLNLEEDNSEWEQVDRTLDSRVECHAVLLNGSVYNVLGKSGYRNSLSIERLEFGNDDGTWHVVKEKAPIFLCAAVATSAEIFLLQYQGNEIISFNTISNTINRTGIRMDPNEKNSFDAISMEGKLYGFGRMMDHDDDTRSHPYKLTEYDIPCGSEKEIWSDDLEFKSSVITAI